MGKRLRFLGRPPGGASDSSINSFASQISPEMQFSFFGVLRVLFHHRRWLVGVTLAAGILTAAISLFIPNTYTATASLLPSGRGDALSKLKGVTGLSFLDLAKGAAGSEGSSELFPSILSSAAVRDAILARRYTYRDGDAVVSHTMREYLDAPTQDDARNELTRLTRINSDFKTGVVNLSFESAHPTLSALVAQAYIDELEKFNRTQRTTQAGEYAKYLAGQLAETHSRLTDAESALTGFRLANREWMSSTEPELREEVARLEREVELSAQMYAFLSQQHEVARGEAQKETPVVQVLDRPSPPELKTGPRRTLMTLTAMLAALTLAAMATLVRGYIRAGSQVVGGAAVVGGAVAVGREAFSAFRQDIRRAYPRLWSDGPSMSEAVTACEPARREDS